MPGTLKASRGKHRVASRSFSITAGKYRTVKLRMSKKDLRTLVRKGKLVLTVAVATRDDAKTLRRKSVKLTAKPTKAARRSVKR